MSPAHYCDGLPLPGQYLAGQYQSRMYVDSDASDAQQEALLNVYTGKLGGPLADYAQLILRRHIWSRVTLAPLRFESDSDALIDP